MNGDYIIGGVFSIHNNMHTVANNYTTAPESPRCSGRIDPREVRFARALIFAIEEINTNTELLPDVRLGYQIHDSCASVPVAVHAAFQLTNGQDPVFHGGDNCSQSGVVMAVVGESGSTPSISISRIIGSFNIPQVSHYATCACLSDKKQYPTFFRTIPSDQFQADALAKLVKHFGWTWIGAVRSDSDYGNNGMAAFLEVALREGICVEYSEAFYRTNPRSKIQRIADVIRRSTATVVVAFAAIGEMKILLEELARDPSPPRQWIGSEAWFTDTDMLSFTFCAGAIGVAIQQSVIPGFRNFLLDLSPSDIAASTVLTEFWEDAFNCTLSKSTQKRMCNGKEDLKTLESPYTETSQLRITNMVYKAVYAIAHAIQNTRLQNTNFTFDKPIRLEAEEVFTQLKKVNFSQNGYHVSFDANGDPVAFYELVNWQKNERGAIEPVTVGYYDASLPEGQKFRIDRNITWVEGGLEVPVSVCSASCLPGTRKVLQKGKPICCYDCIPCPEGEISNITDSPDCFPCPREFWPNAKKDVCLPKPVEFLSFDEVLGIILEVFSISGACLAIITAVIFFHHRTTPIVRANNSELSFLLLFSLTLCFLCSLTFIGAPSEWSCMLRHTVFGITFVLCISCVLGKTIVVLMAFKATLPGNNVMKWFGAPQQRMTVVSFTFIQVIICIVWLVVSPPFPVKNLTTYKEKIILECALGSAVGFWAVLGYIGLLAVFCFVLAVLARKLPDNFNEAKMITFSMLIFCAVWITFIPAYISSPGKFTVAVEIFAILASSFGLILCIFAPKCFIILLKPEKNTKKYLMNKKFDHRAFRWMMTMVFAVEEINNNSSLLPGVKLGYHILDSCDNVHSSLQALFSLLSFPESVASDKQILEMKNTMNLTYEKGLGAKGLKSDDGAQTLLTTQDETPRCMSGSPIPAVIGLASSSPTRAVAQVLGCFNIPLLSRRNVTGIQWVASEAWVTASLLTFPNFHSLLEGTLGFSFPGVSIPGLKEFLLSVRPSPKPGMEFINMFWEEQFGCQLKFDRNVTNENKADAMDYIFSLDSKNISAVTKNSSFKRASIEHINAATNPTCTGSEDLSLTSSSYTDVSQVRISYNVYKAVFAIAHALHTLLNCNSAGRNEGVCDKYREFTSGQLLYHLRKGNFTNQFQERVYFDTNGEPVPLYDIINWQKDNKGKIRFVKVGGYDGSAPLGQQLRINDSIIVWTGGQSQVPVSQCSTPCPPGSRQARRPGKPQCCFDCLPCADGEISNQTGSTECIKCPESYWSDNDKVKCVAGVEEFLSFSETMGIILVVLTLLGVILTIIITVIFHRFRATPIVKANNSEISFLLLLSLKLCFLCSLVFIGQPSVWTCMLRQAAFGISFVICLSCLLVKTVVVLLAFRANIPSSGGLKLFGPSQQRTMIFCTTTPQICLCVGWLLGAPPFPIRNPAYQASYGKIVLECKEPWPLGFYLLLSYIGLLAFVCLLLAFLGRKLPDTFNEAKLITFSMLIFWAVWICFIPAYVSSPGKFSVAVEIFAILASSFGLLLCIFVPKCYIILLHPERNIRKGVCKTT
ncbi:vomeronasal type-2 receptor 1-like [Anableps anableps]